MGRQQVSSLPCHKVQSLAQKCMYVCVCFREGSSCWICCRYSGSMSEDFAHDQYRHLLYHYSRNSGPSGIANRCRKPPEVVAVWLAHRVAHFRVGYKAALPTSICRVCRACFLAARVRSTFLLAGSNTLQELSLGQGLPGRPHSVLLGKGFSKAGQLELSKKASQVSKQHN